MLRKFYNDCRFNKCTSVFEKITQMLNFCEYLTPCVLKIRNLGSNVYGRNALSFGQESHLPLANYFVSILEYLTDILCSLYILFTCFPCVR